jgi:riboflavin transporter FmnP
MIEKNSIIIGVVLGCIVPVIGFTVVEFLFNMLTHYGLMEEVSTSSMDRRFRTLALIGICFSLIPFNIAKNRRWDQTMRGIIFPTLIYVGAWIYRFYGELFG